MPKTIKEILADFKQTLAVTMQSTRNVVDVTQHYIDLLADAEEGGAGGIDYSTTEQDTGLKWIDGKEIYQKTAFIENVTINKNSSTEVNISSYFTGVSGIVKFECTAYSSSIYPAIYVGTELTGYGIGVCINANTGKIVFTRGSDSNVTISVYLTLQYTKSV